MAVLIDSYSETNGNTAASLPDDTSRLGSSFDSGSGGTLNSAKFYLAKSGTPAGNVVARVYAHTGTYGTTGVPTGAALAVSDNVTATSLSASFTLITFTFSAGNKISISASTKYCIVCEYTAGSAPNNIGISYDSTSPTHGGNFVYWTGSAWDFDSGLDVPFYVYVDDAAAGTVVKDLIQSGLIAFPR